MADEIESGDGVVSVPVVVDEPVKGKRMADPIDLPPNVAAQLQLESISNGQMTNSQGRAIATMATGVLQASMARNFDELDAVEGRSVSGLISTPIGSPAGQAK